MSFGRPPLTILSRDRHRPRFAALLRRMSPYLSIPKRGDVTYLLRMHRLLFHGNAGQTAVFAVILVFSAILGSVAHSLH
jgi:hypothetical protein